MRTTREASSEQERRIAKELGIRIQPNSGATDFCKGDLISKEFLIEAKTNMEDRKSFSVKKEWLEKLKEESFAMNKLYTALAFSFGDGKDYYIIDSKLMKKLLGEED